MLRDKWSENVASKQIWAKRKSSKHIFHAAVSKNCREKKNHTKNKLWVRFFIWQPSDSELTVIFCWILSFRTINFARSNFDRNWSKSILNASVIQLGTKTYKSIQIIFKFWKIIRIYCNSRILEITEYQSHRCKLCDFFIYLELLGGNY